MANGLQTAQPQKKKKKNRLEETAQKLSDTGERARALGEERAAAQELGEGGPFRSAQERLAGRLEAQSTGVGGSAADIQFQRARNAALRAAQAQAASTRGVGAEVAQRGLGEALAQTNLLAGEQAAQIRAQEQAAADQALGGVLGQARGQDISAAQIRGQLQAEFERLGLSADQAAAAAEAKIKELSQNSFFKKLIGGAIGGLGTAAGAFLGGPAGAALGSSLGSALTGGGPQTISL